MPSSQEQAGLPRTKRVRVASRETLVEAAVRGTVRAALRADPPSGTLPQLQAATRVLVRAPQRGGGKPPVLYAKYNALATVAEVHPGDRYRLCWLSPSYDGLPVGALSRKLYHVSELRQPDRALSTADLLQQLRAGAVTALNAFPISSVLATAVLDGHDCVLVKFRGQPSVVWVHRREVPEDVLRSASPVHFTDAEQAHRFAETIAATIRDQ